MSVCMYPSQNLTHGAPLARFVRLSSVIKQRFFLDMSAIQFSFRKKKRIVVSALSCMQERINLFGCMTIIISKMIKKTVLQQDPVCEKKECL